MIYLTYDDGPNPSTTPNLLDVLARESMRHSSSSIVI
jgi:peptidoglycan/xylan/chitin deacetylase (PgdA/CDA1 family)